MNWEPSERADEFDGCRFCLHYRGRATCAAYPDRIPLPIFAGDVDHMVPRPGQVGDAVFEPIDEDLWRATGERRPASQPARAR
jgi:hypothetical protein